MTINIVSSIKADVKSPFSNIMLAARTLVISAAGKRSKSGICSLISITLILSAESFFSVKNMIVINSNSDNSCF